MELEYLAAYASHGLTDDQQSKLSRLGDFVLSAGFNVTGLAEPREIERNHFLDSLSLLSLPAVPQARRIVDIGSGAGFPALVLAVALPESQVVAVEAVRKKCDYIDKTGMDLGLSNLVVRCSRAEDYGRSSDRERFDTAVSRAVASLAVVAEYSIPLLRVGGTMIAMKGLISDQERIQGSRALAILGAGRPEALRLEPFRGSLNRWAYLATKTSATPESYPRRAGLPAKRPLG